MVSTFLFFELGLELTFGLKLELKVGVRFAGGEKLGLALGRELWLELRGRLGVL